MLQLPYGHRGVIVCGFNQDGSKLATVGPYITFWS
jgi:hypothetical protein